MKRVSMVFMQLGYRLRLTLFILLELSLATIIIASALGSLRNTASLYRFADMSGYRHVHYQSTLHTDEPDPLPDESVTIESVPLFALSEQPAFQKDRHLTLQSSSFFSLLKPPLHAGRYPEPAADNEVAEALVRFNLSDRFTIGDTYRLFAGRESVTIKVVGIYDQAIDQLENIGAIGHAYRTLMPISRFWMTIKDFSVIWKEYRQATIHRSCFTIWKKHHRILTVITSLKMNGKILSWRTLKFCAASFCPYSFSFWSSPVCLPTKC